VTTLLKAREAVARLVTGRHLNEMATLAARVFGMCASLAAGAVTARALGPHDRGAYYYVVATASVLAQIGSVGSPSSNPYFAAQRPEFARRLLLWTVLVAAASCGCFWMLLAVAPHWSPLRGLWPDAGGDWLVPLTAAALLLAAVGPILAGLHAFWQLNAVQVGGQCLMLVGFIAVAAHRSIENFLAISCTASAVSVAIQMLLIFRLTKPHAPSAEVRFADWAKYGGRAYATFILAALVTRASVFFLKTQSTSTQLGYYSVAAQIFDAFTLIPASLAMVLLPTILRDQRLSWADCRKELVRMTLFMSAVVVPAALILPSVVTLVFGERFAPSIPPALCLLAASIMISIVTVTSQFLAAIGYPWVMIANWLAALCLVAVGATFWAPRFGAVGAAWATFMAYAGLAVLSAFTARRLLPTAQAAGASEG
jgi:O-antigen/teichoic acid export membrane protein